MNDVTPQQNENISKMQGHWVMAKLGKRVLRPGGRNLTKLLLNDLAITSSDSVVEFAPGMGATAELTLSKQPRAYTAVDREGVITDRMKKLLSGTSYSCVKGEAQNSGLPDATATKVYAEAMLTMQSNPQKKKIIEEAFRLLKPGGLYGIHEVGIKDSVSDTSVMKEIRGDLSREIKVGASPLLNAEWKALLEEVGFEIVSENQTPFHLLEPHRIVQDEGFWGALKFFRNALRFPAERKAVLSMKRVFRKHENSICGIALVARKKVQ